MIPLQVIPGLGSGPLLIGGLVFALMLAGTLILLWLRVRDSGAPWDAFADACAAIVEEEDADAIAFIPYSDGPLIPKPAIYDKDLLGGKGGYRTPDGDRIYVDGQGNGKYSLQGVDVILGIDPTEHAAAADPLKAWVAHLKNIGEWIKVDREGTVIEAGAAVKNLDGEPVAMDIPKRQGVTEGAGDASNGTAAADGGFASAVHETAHKENMSLQEAKQTLESRGQLHKLVDIASPREAVIDEATGEVQMEEATHVAVDVSSAADLLPKKTNTTAWQTMEEKARQEGRDQDKVREHILVGIVIGAATSGITAVVIALVMGFL